MIKEFALYVLTSASVAAALMGGVIWLLREWIGERLKSSIKHEYDREIEHYKSVVARVHAATAEGQKAAIEARMRAFDRIWKAMLALRKSTGSLTLHFDICTLNEYPGLPKRKNFIDIVGDLDDQRIMRLIPDEDIEEVRPYVGEVVWAHFYLHRAVLMRLVLLASWSIQKDPSHAEWTKDKGIQQLLAAALSQEENNRFEKLTLGRVEFINRAIEMKVLAAWERIISGVTFGEEALKHAQELLDAEAKLRNG